jgi:hypothetical protein
MFIILLATTLSGILFSKLLLVLDVADFRIRYPLIVALSYLVFFACIRLWLSFLFSIRKSKSSVTDWINLPDSFGGRMKDAFQSFRGGGGRFGGAGASGTFDAPQQTALATVALPQAPPPISGGTPKVIGNTIGKAVGSLADDDIIVVVIALVALIVTILISAFILLYGAPAILSEAVFNGVLAASLIKRTRAISEKAWAESVFKASWKPFALTISVAFIAGLILHNYFPHAIRLADIFGKH